MLLYFRFNLKSGRMPQPVSYNKMLMIKVLFLLTFISALAQKNYAQDCTCETNFRWVKKTFEENDAGFRYIINKKGKDAYQIHNQIYLDKVKRLPNNNKCAETIDNWIRFFRNGHIGVRYLKENIPPKKIISEKYGTNYNDFIKYLDKLEEKEQNLEGVWTMEGYKIGIKKRNNEYVGFILESQDKAWQLNDIKMIFSNNRGTYYSENKIAEQINVVKTIGHSYLQLGRTTLKKIYPHVEEEEKITKGYEQLNAKKPFFQKLNETTAYLRIPFFEITEKPAIDSIIAKNRDIILSTENLIIDVRNNPGGSDASFKMIMPFLYTNPIRTVGAEFLSTKLNNQRMLDLYNNPEFDSVSRKTFKKYYETLNLSLGKFVNLFDEKVSIDTMDNILPYPKNVGILIHQGNGSTTEQFLLSAKQSQKVKLFGRTTHGMLDISNVNIIKSPCNDLELYYGLSKSFRVPDFAIDDIGLQPDYFIDSTVPDYGWVEHVIDIFKANKQ